MRYLGGKARIGDKIADFINDKLQPGQTYWEPFCGSCWITYRIDAERTRLASDIHTELIAMWQSLQNGWIPPDVVTEEQYQEIRHSINNLPMKAFAGFGCSFAGRYFEGYARSKDRQNYALCAKNSLLKKLQTLYDVEFFCSDYREFNPPKGTFVYCDCPYVGTKPYRNKFITDDFWQWVRTITIRGYTVLCSEYTAPTDFCCVAEFPTKTNLRMKDGSNDVRVERLFMYDAEQN